ncbi:MAG: 16S rRNA (cytosine(1402)-N(4))-methyltransferase RsmH [Calditrichia bacterium]
MKQDPFHIPVLLDTVVELLITKPDGIYVDCTLGGGGHSEAILRNISEQGFLVGLDADPDAIEFSRRRLSRYRNKLIQQVFYNQLDVVLAREDLLPVHGFLFDLGISSYQIEEEKKGFAYQINGPLDMRFNPNQELTAEVVVNTYSEAELLRVLREYGEERHSRRIVEAIIKNRRQSPIRTTKELSEIVRGVIGPQHLSKTLARVFQAIRIEVNDELNRLKEALEKAFRCLDKHGRIVTVAYHSLEDRIVKEFFQYKAKDCICPVNIPQCVCNKQKEMEIITRKPIRPAPEEVAANSRARSARLRAAEKTVLYRRFF